MNKDHIVWSEDPALNIRRVHWSVKLDGDGGVTIFERGRKDFESEWNALRRYPELVADWVNTTIRCVGSVRNFDDVMADVMDLQLRGRGRDAENRHFDASLILQAVRAAVASLESRPDFVQMMRELQTDNAPGEGTQQVVRRRVEPFSETEFQAAAWSQLLGLPKSSSPRSEVKP
jgi:hypothetical protein